MVLMTIGASIPVFYAQAFVIRTQGGTVYEENHFLAPVDGADLLLLLCPVFVD